MKNMDKWFVKEAKGEFLVMHDFGRTNGFHVYDTFQTLVAAETACDMLNNGNWHYKWVTSEDGAQLVVTVPK